MRLKLVCFILVFSLMATLAFARTAPYQNDADLGGRFPAIPLADDPTTDYRYHDVGKVWLTVSNWGFIGNPDDNNMPYYPSAMYPGGSNIEFLFQGAVWFGAVVGSRTDPDTITTVGVDGWQNDNQNDMFPGTQPWDTLFVRGPEHAGVKGVDEDGDWDPATDDINQNGVADVDFDGPEEDANGDGNFIYDPEGHFYRVSEGYSRVTHTPVGYDPDLWNNRDYAFFSSFDEDPKGDPYRRAPGASFDPDWNWTTPYDDDGDGQTDEDGEAISEQDFIGSYSDIHGVSVTDLYPLGINVTQKSYAWSYSYSDDYVLIDYTIENIGGLPPGGAVDEEGFYSLRDCWLGMYIDGDVGPNWNLDYSGIAQDDLTGFIMEDPDFAGQRPQNLFLGYIFDGPNNYEGHGDNAIWDGFLGVRIIDVYKTTLDLSDPDNPKYVREPGVDIENLNFSFNWWLSDSNNADFDETPMFDSPKYARMANYQDDYYAVPDTRNAVYLPGQEEGIATADPGDLTNWPQPDVETARARGITALPPDGPRRVTSPGTEDTRFLVSYGPFEQLRANERLHITVGVIMGFTFKNLLQNAYWAKTVYDFNFKGPTPPPSPRLTVEPYGGGRVKLTWVRDPEATRDPITDELDFEGYRVWRSRSQVLDSFAQIAEFDLINGGQGLIGDTRFDYGLPGENPNYFPGQAGQEVNADGDTVFYFIDTNVTENFTYYYSVTSFDRGVPGNGVPALGSSINNQMTEVIPSTPAGKKLIENEDGELELVDEYSMDDIMVIPNPYRGDVDYSSSAYGNWESARSEYNRLIKFTNLPDGEVTIRIYTIAGDLVRELRETLQKGDHSTIDWDLLTRSNQRVVSGVYIYSVESKYGTKVDKFAIIR